MDVSEIDWGDPATVLFDQLAEIYLQRHAGDEREDRSELELCCDAEDYASRMISRHAVELRPGAES